MTTIIQIPLNKLVPGDKAKGGSINSRKTEEPIDGLVRSIEAHGLLVPLLVRGNGAAGTYCIMDGNRRLAALKKLKTKTPDIEVPCIEHSEGNALELSMVVNVDRAELHPVDRFEVFAALVEAGDTVDAIAKRYGMKVPHVRQALALGKLSPAVRDAWRGGRLTDAVAEAFAVTSDHKAQDAALKKCGKYPSDYDVRRQLVGLDVHAAQLLALVGRDAYEKAGHFVNASLFFEHERNEVTVSDLPALRRMADEAMSKRCDDLIKSGWKWALPRTDMPNDFYAWKRVAGPYSKEQKAQLGCIISISYDGEVEVTAGYAKPGDKIALPKSPADKKAATKAKAERAERKEESGGLSNALAFRLSQQLTAAVREAFTQGAAGDVIVSCAIAALACTETPLCKLRLDMTDEKAANARFENDFAKYLKLALGKTAGQRAELLASWLSHAIDFTVHQAPQLATLLHPGKDEDVGSRALVALLNPGVMAQALRKHFDAADYFNSVSRELVEQAVEEALGKDHAERVVKMKTAAEAKEYAAKHVGKTSWVPPQMRIGKPVLS